MAGDRLRGRPWRDRLLSAAGLRDWSTAEGHDHGSPSDSFTAFVRHHLPDSLWTMLFLVAVSAILHELHTFEALTAQSMRWVYRVESSELGRRWATHQLPPLVPAYATVHILRFTTASFHSDFRAASPVPRDAMARALAALATALEAAGPVRPVIGIDVDIAPPPAAAASAACGGVSLSACEALVDEALRRLRVRADVVAITSGRQDFRDRATRNSFLKAQCDANGIVFGTSLAFVDPAEPHYRFLTSGVPEWQEGTIFPSLGNLMAEVAQSPAEGFPPSRALVIAKSGLCAQKTALQSVGELEWIDGWSVDPGKQFRWQYLDLLRSSVRALPDDVASITDLEQKARSLALRWAADAVRADAEPKKVRPMLIISIDDGRTDKHFSVMDRTALSDGDFLQASTALSFIEPLAAHEGRTLWKSALYDLGLGLVFMVVWLLIAYGLAKLWALGFETIAGAATSIAPLALSFSLGLGAMLYAAAALPGSESRSPTWNDPLLILIGLTLHAYLTVWDVAADAKKEASTGGNHAEPVARPVLDLKIAGIWQGLRFGVVVGTIAGIGLLAAT